MCTSYQIWVNYPFFGEDKGRQMADGRRKKDFSQKGGYQGGFGINSSLFI